MSQPPSPEARHRAGLLRRRGAAADGHVTNIELFFDLVFVYAVTQLSHTLLQRLDALGALQAALLFLAVWWVWIFTGWVTNWLDPERIAVRLMLLALMLAGLLLSCALPEAFGAHGWLFAGAYASMQVGRTAFALWALGDDAPANTRNFQRILAWLSLAALGWLAGAWAGGERRLLLWTLALGVEYLGPAVGFRVPGLGRTPTRDWDVEGGHLAERCSLFVIIALGESVLATGSHFAEAAWSAPVVAAFVGGFLGNVAMWWIYFDLAVERGRQAIRHAEDPGRQARVAYTYLHLPIVGGIIVCAVADALALEEPLLRADLPAAAVLLGGPLLYLLGNALFKQAVNRTRFPLSHLVGIGLLAALAVPAALGLSRLALSLLATGVLLLAALWETLSLRSVRQALAEAGGA
ncbi:low temperature requirement protein A [Fulvimonas soli]|jgi:low temperature requirement protein LtrA|uniref:Low temperature requirement protein LtrA n=1 Tax=Fulvimonas soli TaxID=155197 RepID=A0A316I0T7_9GAMM|nr:low temperature requirement protein A [Fulvimonas soli]PWK85902.1 low temperature requirement protein LtrA [Fulvimonas soli]